MHVKNTPLAPDADIDALVTSIDGFVGADIEGLIREAAIGALRRDMNAGSVAKKDFDEALAKSKPSVSPEITKRFRNYNKF